MTTRRFVLLLLLVAASRLPFIGDGYGSDADAWHVAASAHQLAESGTYRVSRFPGFPLHELLVTPFVAAGGSLLSNATSIAAMLLLLMVWRSLTRNASHPALLIVCLAFTPVLWKSSVTTMDYLWSLLFILLSFERLRTDGEPGKGRVLAAGVFFGIAAGFRPTNAAMALPLVTLLIMKGDRGRSTALFLSSAVMAATAAFLPPLLTYGPAQWYLLTRRATEDIVFPLSERLLLFSYRSLYLLGPLALVTAGVICWNSRRSIVRDLAAPEPAATAALAGMVAPLLVYFAYPLEREYLIPLIPFFYLLLDRYATRLSMVLFTAAVASMALFTPDLIRHQGIRGVPGLNIHTGVLPDFVERSRLMLRRRETLGNLAVSGPAVVMTGGGSEVWVENPLFVPDTAAFWREFPEIVVHRRDDPGVHIIDALSPGDVDRVRRAGYRVYCYAPAQEYLEKVLRYRMDSLSVPLAGASSPVPPPG
jgi:hypothetical protein